MIGEHSARRRLHCGESSTRSSEVSDTTTPTRHDGIDDNMKYKPKIIGYGHCPNADDGCKSDTAYMILEWPDGSETCAWKHEHVRRKGAVN